MNKLIALIFLFLISELSVGNEEMLTVQLCPEVVKSAYLVSDSMGNPAIDIIFTKHGLKSVRGKTKSNSINTLRFVDKNNLHLTKNAIKVNGELGRKIRIAGYGDPKQFESLYKYLNGVTCELK